MQISICTDALFAGMDTVEAMQAVKAENFRAIEFWSWENKDIEAIDQARRELDMKIAAFCTSFVSLTDPGQRTAYIDGLRRSIEAAKRLDCPLLISQVGSRHSSVAGEDYRSIVDGLQACVPYLETAGITLVIEPLNTRQDHGGYYLTSSDEAARIIDDVASEHVKLLFDFYHQQISEGDVLRRSTAIMDRIGHIHAAGNPGRSELYRGELNYKAIFDALVREGYQGYVGLEYRPVDDYREGLRKLQEYR